MKLKNIKTNYLIFAILTLQCTSIFSTDTLTPALMEQTTATLKAAQTLLSNLLVGKNSSPTQTTIQTNAHNKAINDTWTTSTTPTTIQNNARNKAINDTWTTSTAAPASSQTNARNQAITDKWAIDKTTNAGSSTPAQTNARNQAIADKWVIDKTINAGSSTPAQTNARNQAIADKWAIDNATNAGSSTPAQTNARNQAIADKWAIDKTTNAGSSTPAQTNARNQAIADKWAIDKTTNAGSSTPAQTNARNQAIADKWTIDNATKADVSTQTNARNQAINDTWKSVTYSTNFYNNCGADMVIQPYVNKVASGQLKTVPYVSSAIYTPTSVTISGFTGDTITYSVFIASYHNLNNNNQVLPALVYNATTGFAGYQIGISGQSITAIPFIAPMSTTFYNGSSQPLAVQALVDGTPSGAPVTIPYTATNPLASGVVTIPGTTGTVTYSITMPGSNYAASTAAYNPTAYPNGYTIGASPAVGIVGDGITTPPPTTVTMTFYNDTAQTMRVQPLVNGQPSGAFVDITYIKTGTSYNSAAVPATAQPNQQIAYTVIVPNTGSNSTTVPYNATAFGYQINTKGNKVNATVLTGPYASGYNFNSYNSYSLGRMSSQKKTMKKSKRSRSNNNKFMDNR